MFACRGDGSPPAPSSPTLEIVTDGETRTVAITRPVRLSSLVPVAPERWLEVRVEAVDDRWLELPTPATTYAGAELRVSLERGRVAFGVFAAGPTPLASLVPVARIAVMTRLPATPGLKVERDGRAVVVTGDRIRELAPVSEGARLWGWPLAGVVALAEAISATPRRVRVIGDTEVVVEAEALEDPARRHVLKLNQRGEYVFRVWDKGARRPTREVRRVTGLVVE